MKAAIIRGSVGRIIGRERHRSVLTSLAMLLCLGTGPGCVELYILFGPGGVFPAEGSGTSPTTGDPGSGGVTTGGGTSIPTTTQPAAVAPPAYRVSLLDDLLEQAAGATMIAETDLDDDGVADFASISSQSEVVLLHIRDPATQLFDQLSIAGGLPLTRMVRIASADFDADGNIDLAVAVNDTGLAPPTGASKVGNVVLIFAPADPRDQLNWLTVPLTNAFRGNDDNSITDMAVADYNGDSLPDIAFMSNEPPPPGGTPLRFVFMFINPGAGLARDGTVWGTPRPSFLGVQPPFVEVDAPTGDRVIPADIDMDGDIDLVASFPPAESLNIRWLENPGPALVDPDPAMALPRWNRHFLGQQDGGANAIALGDIDNDGDLDLAASTNLQRLTQWFQNPGLPDVAIQAYPWEVYNIGTVTNGDINQLHLADLDNNGSLDVWLGAGDAIVGFFPRTGADFLDYWTPFSVVSTEPDAVIGFPAFLDIDSNGTTDFVVPLDRDGVDRDQFAIFTRN